MYGVTPILYPLCFCGCGTNVCSQLGNHRDVRFMPAFVQPHRNMAWGGGPMCEGCRLVAYPPVPPQPQPIPNYTPQQVFPHSPYQINPPQPIPNYTSQSVPQSVQPPPQQQVFHQSSHPHFVKKPLEQNDSLPINANTPYETEELKTKWEYDESSTKKNDLKNYEPA